MARRAKAAVGEQPQPAAVPHPPGGLGKAGPTSGRTGWREVASMLAQLSPAFPPVPPAGSPARDAPRHSAPLALAQGLVM